MDAARPVGKPLPRTDTERDFMEQAVLRPRCQEQFTRENATKGLIAIAATALVATVAASPGEARQGCGRGFHRAPNGMCRPNRDQQMRWVDGRYYSGRGYWWHNRWYHHRHRRNGIYVYL